MLITVEIITACEKGLFVAIFHQCSSFAGTLHFCKACFFSEYVISTFSYRQNNKVI